MRWTFCIDGDGEVLLYPTGAPTATPLPTATPSLAPSASRAPSAPSPGPTTRAPTAPPSTSAPTTASPTLVSCGSSLGSGACGGAALLGYGFVDANACANRAAATPACGSYVQFSEARADEVGCWCCPSDFEPPGDASSTFDLYEVRAGAARPRVLQVYFNSLESV